jgi:DNA modification methylase
MPWMIAFALREDGWYLRSEIIWHKPNPMPESVRDRPTKAHEQIFLLAKSERYFFNQEAVKEPAVCEHPSGNGYKRPEQLSRNGRGSDTPWQPQETRNIRSVWKIATQPYREAHFATFPRKLIEPCIKAGCPVGGTVLDPFGGAGTTGLEAESQGKNAILIEANQQYCEMSNRRLGLTA